MTDVVLPDANNIYGVGIVLATLSLIVILLIIPPVCWHFRSSNVGATFFIGWTILLLLFNFVNALLWDEDNVGAWYDGAGLCDIEVKLQIASQVGIPTAFACVLRGLATVMNTERSTLIPTRSQRRQTLITDLVICIFFPLWQMLMHFIAQPSRYYVFGISGCRPSLDSSWLGLLLVLLPSGLWLLLDGYYAVLILLRLYRYRLTFKSIMASSNTTKSRFLRLYLICFTWLVASIVIWGYEMWWNTRGGITGFHWSHTHNPATWNQIIKVPSNGYVLYDSWVWVVIGSLIFAFFGFGREAANTHRRMLLSVGMGRIIPALRFDHTQVTSSEAKSFLSQKAKKLFTKDHTISPSSKCIDVSIDSTLTSSSLGSPLKPDHSFKDETLCKELA